MEAIFKASILILIWLINIVLIIVIKKEMLRIQQEKEFNKEMINKIKNMSERGGSNDTKRDDK